jgi:hypothetical protein
MSIELLERAVDTFGPLVDEVVFVGGSTVSLHVTEPGGTSFRPTLDVDVIIEAVTRVEYEAFAERLRGRGISEDSTSNVICRWRRQDPDLIIDVMPVAEKVFGFANRWYPEAMRSAVLHELPSGRSIRICSAAVLLATKLEAFADRGASDPMISHDLEDIVRLVDGRPSIVGDVAAADDPLAEYVRAGLRNVLQQPIMRDSIPMLMLPDDGSQLRAASVVIPRMERIAGTS